LTPLTSIFHLGFYIDASLFPSPKFSIKTHPTENRLSLGPFCGKPACQFIDTSPNIRHGVCAEAFLKRKTILVQNVHDHAGHIACDRDTKSEIVCPLFLTTSNGVSTIVGVLDLDCLATGGFDEADKDGLESIAKLIAESCDW
jgi:L-methionine (R)-S-oxide reductase